jgi:hypothetical protein
MGMARTVDAARIGERQIGATLLQLADMGVDTDPLGLGEIVPPFAELVGVFDWPLRIENTIPL